MQNKIKSRPSERKAVSKSKKLIRMISASLIEMGVMLHQSPKGENSKQNKKPPFRKKGGFKK
jgi:hypothetical protein